MMVLSGGGGAGEAVKDRKEALAFVAGGTPRALALVQAL